LIDKQWRTFEVGIGAALMDEAAVSSLAADANRRFPVPANIDHEPSRSPRRRALLRCCGQTDRIMGVKSF